jgi:hypothetical protein
MRKAAIYCVLLVSFLLPALAEADSAWQWSDDGKTNTLYLADVRAKKFLGFGWQPRTRVFGRMARWIGRLEADVRFDVDEVQDINFTLTAVPRYHHYRQQNIGLVVNGSFIEEWVCPKDFEYRDYSTVIPGDVLKKGPNTITLRMGYRRREGKDPRELALAVDRIVLSTD